jgi:hypothetical protein
MSRPIKPRDGLLTDPRRGRRRWSCSSARWWLLLAIMGLWMPVEAMSPQDEWLATAHPPHGLLPFAIAFEPSLLADESARSADSATPTTSPHPQPPETVTETAAQLIEQLSHRSLAVRRQALERLEQLGPDALPALPDPDSLTQASARDAVARLRQRWERQSAEQSCRPSLVRLHPQCPQPVDSVTGAALSTIPGRVLASIEQQTGNRIVADEALMDRPLSLPCDDREQTFWNSITRLEQQWPVDTRWDPAEKQLRWMPRPAEGFASPASAAGPLRLVIVDQEWRGGTTTASGPSQRLLRLRARLQVEPRLEPLFVQLAMNDWHGRCEGDAVRPWNAAAEYELPFAEGQPELTWTTDWVWPPRLDPSIKPADRSDRPTTHDDRPADAAKWTLQGKATLHLAAQRHLFVLDPAQLATRSLQRRGSMTLRLKSAQFVPSPTPGKLDAVIAIQLAYDQGGPAFESHRVGLFHRSARLVDGDGNAIGFQQHQVSAEQDGALLIEYRFPELGGTPRQYRFEYSAPTLLMALPLEFPILELPTPKASPAADQP